MKPAQARPPLMPHQITQTLHKVRSHQMPRASQTLRLHPQMPQFQTQSNLRPAPPSGAKRPSTAPELSGG